ncbi:MAG: phosphoenolpyruvate carboxylase [Acidobacteriota bacterium]|nr:phosphoenolpyruvate carboxylase [Acidobacteriota bacterium]
MKFGLPGALQQFQDQVGFKFQLYNGLFLSLPYDRIEKTGILLSLFVQNCEEGFLEKHLSPQEIIEDFFNNHTSITAPEEKLDLLFRFVQYAERQVVLFDALEDAAFQAVNDVQGSGTLKHLQLDVAQNNKQLALSEKLREFWVRLVLTAHPTQFYPGSVLGIINDLSEAIKENNVAEINSLLQQLGRTPFIKREKPTPFDEAVSLIWYLENVFYEAVGNIVTDLNQFLGGNFVPVRMGFWSGGDRDGNPFVTVETTLQVAEALRSAILRCYYRDVRRLKRRLTFAGVDAALLELEQKLYQNIYQSNQNAHLKKSEILELLETIRRTLHEKHGDLFVGLINNLINKVESFGLFFASLDVRQEASVHGKVLEQIAAETDSLPENYSALGENEKIELLARTNQAIEPDLLVDDLAKDTLETMRAIKTIQQQNGAEGCNRYIISQCGTALNAIEVFGLFLLAGWRAEELNVDIVPLFETIADLRNVREVMRRLYEFAPYREHLARRGNQQTIMLGFSDGTKDGGYLTANWSIYKAKDELTKVSQEHGIKVVFFDGRGGPPARGGGKTHRFYSSMGANVSNRAIELTIQGQTVSSNFGAVEAAQYNIEQLMHAGLYEPLFGFKENTFTAEEENLMQQLADESYQFYEELKNHPAFLDYLSDVSPLRFYAETNIGSRPAKRGASGKLELKDLRAIPFVGAWSQLKQNVPGYYGVGTALEKMEGVGKLEKVKEMYLNNSFFKALMDNCEMAMQKSFFPLTRFLSENPVYGDLWRAIYEEFELTQKYLFLISGKSELMADYPVEKQSIQMRERIMLPLTTIQQYALTKLRESGESSSENKKAYEKLVMRCSFGIINAGRNSA